MARSECKRGHPYDEANTYGGGGANGRRQCRACNRLAAERYRQKGRLPGARACPDMGDSSIDWRTLDWLPGYEISENGDVRRVATIPYHPPQKLRGTINLGYRYFGVLVNGRMRNKAAHRLVCEAWHGPPPFKGAHAAHGNGQRCDNRYTNLRWATPKQNAADRVQHGTHLRGAASPNAKLDWATVREIRQARTGQRGEICEISRRFGVPQVTISRILRGVRWKEDGA